MDRQLLRQDRLTLTQTDWVTGKQEIGGWTDRRSDRHACRQTHSLRQRDRHKGKRWIDRQACM